MNKQTKIIICKIVCMNSISGREKEGDIGCVLACPTTMYKTSTPVLKSVISNKRKIHYYILPITVGALDPSLYKHTETPTTTPHPGESIHSLQLVIFVEK